MTLDELLPLGLDILVFKDDVPTNPNRRSYLDEDDNPSLNMDGYTLIDARWISTQTLGVNADDKPLKEAYDEARKRYFGFSSNSPDPKDPEKFRLYHEEWEKRNSEYEQRSAEYDLFRPSILTELIKSKDLVVVPKTLVEKVRAEIPEAKIAVLEDARLDGLQLRVPATQENNYPRVLVRASTDRYGKSDESRIDADTISLLFKQESNHRPDWYSIDYSSFRAFRSIDPLFYQVFDSNTLTFTNPVERSTTLTHHPRRIMRSSHGTRIRIADESDIEVTLNDYGMGQKQKGIRFLERLREDKVERVQKLYEELWTHPLDSITDILDRQTLIGELVESPQHFETVRGLETAINAIYEPYTHLSNMSKLISANILRSRWSGPIEKTSFYNDFMEIARTFVECYEQMSHSLRNLKTDSREMKVLLEPLRALVESGTPIDQTYRFLRDTLDSAPGDFESLRTIFQQELERRGATKIEELEKYNPNKDSWVREKFGREKISAVGSRKSPYLRRLLERFHSQNPVTSSESGTTYLDYVGSKLAAYTTMAEFVRNKGWTRPEILPGEEGIVDIRNGWYPLTRLQQSAGFIGNDTLLNTDYRVEIIDGVNAGGKTIDTKKALFIAALALTGTYVPAEHARISFFNRIRFRIKQTGMYETSALRGEISELESALKALGTPILLGLDETFTSTNSIEGEAMTYGLVQRLAQDGMARAIITSHYPTLQEIAHDPQVPGVKFSHFEFQRDGSRLVFSYQKLEGPNTMGDYAIAIAENEHLHPGILQHAKQYAGRPK